MTTWRRHRTAVDSIVGQLVGLDTLATAVSIEGHVVQCNNPANAAVLPGVVVDGPGRIARLDLSAWLGAANLGEWDLTWHPVFGDGSTPVWPEEPATDKIVVLK